MLVDDIRSLKRPVPEDPMLAALANAHNDAIESAARLVDEAFSPPSGSLDGAVLPPGHPDHPVGAAIREAHGMGMGA